MPHLAAVLLILLGAASAPATPGLRTWTDATGKFTVQASFVALEGEAVKLQNANGKVITVPLARLSHKDRKYAESRGKQGRIGVQGILLTKSVLNSWRDDGIPKPPVKIGVLVTYIMPG